MSGCGVQSELLAFPTEHEGLLMYVGLHLQRYLLVWVNLIRVTAGAPAVGPVVVARGKDCTFVPRL